MPFASVVSKSDLHCLKGHDEFFGVHSAIKVNTVLLKGAFGTDQDVAPDSIGSLISLEQLDPRGVRSLRFQACAAAAPSPPDRRFYKNDH